MRRIIPKEMLKLRRNMQQGRHMLLRLARDPSRVGRDWKWYNEITYVRHDRYRYDRNNLLVADRKQRYDEVVPT